MSIAMSFFSLLGTFIIGFSMLPQTISTLKTKDTANLSLLLYLMMGIATAFLTIYGIGLVIIPNPNSLSGEAQQALMNAIGPGTFQVGSTSEIDAVQKNWIFSFIVPGAALIFGELICSATSFIVAFLKIFNMMQAKKHGISEEEYIISRKTNVKSHQKNKGKK